MRLVTKIVAAASMLFTGAGLASTPGAAQTGATEAHVYATVGFDKIKPELVLDALDGTVRGTYTATQSEAELDAIYRTGTYGITSGTLEGEFSGNTLTGYWYETAYNAGLQGYCDTERNGTRVYGRFVLTFSADRKSFTGLRTGCEIEPDAYEHSYSTWTGKGVGRVAPSPSTAALPTSRQRVSGALGATAVPPEKTRKKMMSAAQAAGPDSAELAYVYATLGFDKIKPELVLDTRAATVTGTYTATQSEAELDAIYRTGTYGITSGTLEGQFAGNTLTGYWYETAYNAGLQGYCDTERNGTRVYGRFVLTFSADRKSFTGLRTGCEIVPDAYEHSYSSWTGTLVRRQAATAAAGAAPAQASADTPRPSSATPPGANPVGRIIGSAARAAEDEADAKAKEAARKAARGILDRLF